MLMGSCSSHTSMASGSGSGYRGSTCRRPYGLTPIVVPLVADEDDGELDADEWWLAVVLFADDGVKMAFTASVAVACVAADTAGGASGSKCVSTLSVCCCG